MIVSVCTIKPVIQVCQLLGHHVYYPNLNLVIPTTGIIRRNIKCKAMRCIINGNFMLQN